jgi:hypothetical protein
MNYLKVVLERSQKRVEDETILNCPFLLRSSSGWVLLEIIATRDTTKYWTNYLRINITFEINKIRSENN